MNSEQLLEAIEEKEDQRSDLNIDILELKHEYLKLNGFSIEPVDVFTFTYEKDGLGFLCVDDAMELFRCIST